MLNFEYKNTVKVIFGKDTISKVAREIPKNAKVLMTFGGGSIKKNGVYDQVISALKQFSLFEFGGIEPNPRYETCMKAVELVKTEKIDFLLSVGGGSVLDATKFIAAAAQFDAGDPWLFFEKRGIVVPKTALPLGAILTLPATGSEMNGNTVITRNSTQEKKAFGSPLLLPQFSILNPECVYTLPERQIANGIVDAFVHVMEQYLTYPVNSPLQDRLAESVLMTLIEEGQKVLANKKDYESAANFMWSATVALNGWISPGVPQDWSTHIISHDLTAFHEIDHARTLAIIFPGTMNIKRENKKEKIIQYGERIWGIKTGSDDERINATIEKTVEFFESVGLPTTLSAYDVGEDTINKIVDRFKNSPLKLGEKADIDFNEIEMILKDRL